ncbi:hypothetical protein [Paraburkholderia tagetis]|uniref:Uncharacterized protein n=1 Tax=Paraburkholderia tagetis TaxID=2913261 RepID=A0A9X1UNK6_9BURK|nr:hypothetical protein [Paraburkholderia tagetis]MCG5078397.1 hypothetical protein [Paraburkholderia tagetis]
MATSTTIKTAAVSAAFLRVNFIESIALNWNIGFLLYRHASLAERTAVCLPHADSFSASGYFQLAAILP